MASNILDKYRKAQEETIKVETVAGQPYKAFEVAAGPQRRIDLRPGRDAQRIVNYGYLFEISHAAGMLIGLMFSTPMLSVRIEGKNLQSLVDGLREEKVIAIQEYIPEWHQKPADNEPIIKKLQITTRAGTTERPATSKH